MTGQMTDHEAPPAVSNGAVLACEHVTVEFGGVAAVSDVSLTVQRGMVHALIGPNGAGKTTLFDVLGGVRRPKQGRVYLDGADVTDRSATYRARRGVRRTFQRQQPFGSLTVEENLLVPLEWVRGGGGMAADLFDLPTRRAFERRRRAKVADVLHRTGLTAVADVQAAHLPIGVMRMVEFARALVSEPSVLMLDEPVSGLERSEANRLGEILQELVADGRTACLVVEHDVDFVMRFSSLVSVLNLGLILAEGTPDEVRRNPAVLAAYLE
jgi:branched-chain amino acid transport system ATP-binding protein